MSGVGREAILARVIVSVNYWYENIELHNKQPCSFISSKGLKTIKEKIMKLTKVLDVVFSKFQERVMNACGYPELALLG